MSYVDNCEKCVYDHEDHEKHSEPRKNPILDWVRRATRRGLNAPYIYILANWPDTVGCAIQLGLAETPTPEEERVARKVIERLAVA